MGIKSVSISIRVKFEGSERKIYSVNRPSPGPISSILSFLLLIKLHIFFKIFLSIKKF